METLAEPTGGPVAHWGSVLAAGLGLVLGSLGRGLPDALVAAAVSDDSNRGCGDEGIVECATRTVPEAIATTAAYGFLVVALYVAATLLGALLLAVGIRASGQANAQPRPDGAGANRSAWGLVSVTLGTSLLMPTMWVIASAIVGG